MEFQFENFAKAGTGTFAINKLTVICGQNNIGKTYVNYAICSILSSLETLIDLSLDKTIANNLIDELESKGAVKINIEKQIEQLKNYFIDAKPIIKSKISNYLGLPEDNFSDSKISLKLDELNFSSDKAQWGMTYSDCLQILSDFEDGNHVVSISCINWTSESKQTGIENYLKIFNGDKVKAEEKLNEHIVSIIYRKFISVHVPEPFPITSERIGTSLFYKFFDSKNTEILEHFESNRLVTSVSKINSMRSRFAFPILHNISKIRFYEDTKRIKSFLTDDEIDESLKGGARDILEVLSELLDFGKFDSNNDSIVYQPSVEKYPDEPVIPLTATSSSIKSLFLIDLFINHFANPNSLLIIDKPELNLHAENQVKMAKLLARLVNAGIKVLISTHSDFLIREINNFITMSKVPSNSRKSLDCKSNESDYLNKADVSAYEVTTNHRIEKLEVNDSGINMGLLENTIQSENIKSMRIFDAAEYKDEN